MSEPIWDELSALGGGAAIRRATDSQGRSYAELRAGWQPRFGLAYRDLAVGWAVLLAVVVGLPGLQAASTAAAWIAVPFASLCVGAALHHLFLFLHEASHYNLARERVRNDRIADLLLAPVLGQAVAQYRRVHFDHHRFLGTARDPERSYFEALSPRSLIRSLTGVRLLETALHRHLHGSEGRASGGVRFALIAALLHGGLVLVSIATGHLPLALAWTGGVLIVLPFLASVRQTLEHRSEAARTEVDYATVDHGVTNRIFGTGPLAVALGGAGFNRHLLHHWDPQLSYTRLPDLEAFLMETELAGALDRQRTTYWRTLKDLFEAGR